MVKTVVQSTLPPEEGLYPLYNAPLLEPVLVKKNDGNYYTAIRIPAGLRTSSFTYLLITESSNVLWTSNPDEFQVVSNNAHKKLVTTIEV